MGTKKILNTIVEPIKDLLLTPYSVWQILYVAYSCYFTLKGRKICLLGMPDVGKTRILRILQGKEYDEEKDRQTPGGGEHYDSFVCEELGLRVSEGRDINGDEVNIKQYYEGLIKKCYTVIFVFNIYKFLNDKKEESQTKDRFDNIYTLMKDQKKELAFIGTHLDKFENKDEQRKAISKFLDRVRERQYFDMFKCLMAIDATNTKNAKKEMYKIFKAEQT